MEFRNTKGILSENTDYKIDADCIVTAMIIGLFREYIGRKREFIFSFSVDPSDKKSKEEKKRKELIVTIKKIDMALATLGIRNLPKLKVMKTVD